MTLANDDSIKTIIKMIRMMIFMMLIHIHPNKKDTLFVCPKKNLKPSPMQLFTVYIRFIM